MEENNQSFSTQENVPNGYTNTQQPNNNQQNYQGYAQPIYVNVPEKNNLGLAGFIMSIIAILLCWIPILGQILWLLGVVFSAIGIFKKPRGFAIAGLVISFIIFIILIIFIGIAGIGVTSAAMSSGY